MPDKEKKKSQVRESRPLAETPNYNMDASELVGNLKKIQADSAARRAASYSRRKEASDRRREAMNSKGKQSGGGLQGLNTSLGGKIIR